VKQGGVYDRSVRVFSLIYVVLGVVILALTISQGGGPVSAGFLIGIAFIALGVVRYMVQRKVSREDLE